MTLEVCWDGDLWTLSLGLSQLHGHGSWLVCEVALNTSGTWDLGLETWDLGLETPCEQAPRLLRTLSLRGSAGYGGRSK
jgi:hypothetical protein